MYRRMTIAVQTDTSLQWNKARRPGRMNDNDQSKLMGTADPDRVDNDLMHELIDSY